jgi:hypothetical protein
MSQSSDVHNNAQQIVFTSSTTITAAVTGTVITPSVATPKLAGCTHVALLSKFVYGSGGTTAKFWLQTSLDGGVTWFDIVNHAYTTSTASKLSAVTTFIAPATQGAAPTDGSLADNTINQGIIGDRLRIKYTTTGTYAGSTTIAIYALAKG